MFSGVYKTVPRTGTTTQQKERVRPREKFLGAGLGEGTGAWTSVLFLEQRNDGDVERQSHSTQLGIAVSVTRISVLLVSKNVMVKN